MMKNRLLFSMLAFAISPPTMSQDEPTPVARDEVIGQQVIESRIGTRLDEVRVKPETGPAYFIQDRGGDGTLSSRTGGELDSGINIRTWKIGEW
jgi:hypothetical protein